MASTPSASALTSVLWCRNPENSICRGKSPSKRPATTFYSLEITSITTQSRKTLWWGKHWLCSFGGPGWVSKGPETEIPGKNNRFCHPNLHKWTHILLHSLQNALVPQQKLTSCPPCTTFSTFIGTTAFQTHVAKVCKNLAFPEFPAGVLKASIISTCLLETTGQIPFNLSSWPTLKTTGLSLAALVSRLVFLKLLCWSSLSSPHAPQHLLIQVDENMKNATLQVCVRDFITLRAHFVKKAKLLILWNFFLRETDKRTILISPPLRTSVVLEAKSLRVRGPTWLKALLLSCVYLQDEHHQ